MLKKIQKSTNIKEVYGYREVKEKTGVNPSRKNINFFYGNVDELRNDSKEYQETLRDNYNENQSNESVDHGLIEYEPYRVKK